MKLPFRALKLASPLAVCLSWLVLPSVAAWAQANSVYYVCPGNVFTNTLSAKEAEKRGCKAREAQQPTTIAGPRPKSASGAAPAAQAGASAESRVAQSEQRARDSDARRILEQELAKEEDALEALRREYRNGEPERRGDERNFQKYQDRVNEMKAAIARKEGDVAAIKRELSKLGAL